MVWIDRALFRSPPAKPAPADSVDSAKASPPKPGFMPAGKRLSRADFQTLQTPGRCRYVGQMGTGTD